MQRTSSRAASFVRARTLTVVLAVALSVGLLASAAAAQPQAPNRNGEERSSVRPTKGEEAVPGQVIVKYKKDAGPAAQSNVRRAEGLKKKSDLGLINAEVVKVEGRSTESAIRDLNARADVEYAEPDFKAYASGFADEPRFGELWGLDNTGQTINGQQGVANVDANGKEASARTQGSSTLTVAVIDSGVDFSHPDLAARAWKNPGESGSGKETNGVDDDANGYVDDVNGADFVNNDGNPHDDNKHGTHVSGTIAASVDGQGVVGVAPNVKIMALKSFGADGSGEYSDAIKAIQYAKNKGIKISNNSWGGESSSQALKDAIDASGSLFVAAAGNGGSDRLGDNNDTTPHYPSSYASPNILSVAAAGNRGSLATFSNYGKTSVDISAPGVAVLSAVPAIPEKPDLSATALSSVGTSGGKAVTTGFGADEIGDDVKRASFFGKAFEAVDRGAQQVVLVDDDMSQAGYSDVGPTLSSAIQSATGSAPEVIDVAPGNGPSLSQLSGKTVVWATGTACDSDDLGCIGGDGTTLTGQDQATLTNFLNAGGKLVITGVDALYQIEGTPFVTRTLELKVSSDVGGLSPNIGTFAGTPGTAFAGESYAFDSPTAFVDFHDDVASAGTAAVNQGVYPATGNPGTPADWKYLNGTSMATPHVTGAAALVASKYPNLLGQPTAIKKIIMDTGGPLSATAGKTVTGDMVNAQAALFPRVTAASPIATSPIKTGVARGSNVTATFSEAMGATTINGTTFTLVKSGTTSRISATVTYDATAKRATLNPSASLAANTVYTATVKGGSTGVKNGTSPADPMFASKVWSFKTGA